ncbi:VanW family protein [Thermosediminibacter oceani]|uniref:VanW family protein n=1 Tax=Thermosediminibacter oceani (strain ATCC BAA-1034 / DSM 16646 / JW/IW-1228P) TaxID=555079 RepID=D9S3H3_THEOJ|nr:VanW family protein [Thermosediminibacter oceani]ADL07950.1 VanW family protein [Thermosediminibacter oceani DSM 16646]
MKKKFNIIVVILLLFIICSVYGIYCYERRHSDDVLGGVYIGQVYVGGLFREEAEEKVKKYVEENLNNTVTLYYSDKIWDLNPKEIINVKLEKAIDEAISEGKSGNFILRFFNRLKLSRIPKKIDLAAEIKVDPFKAIIERISKDIARKPQNARFKIVDDIVMIEKEIEGIQVDTENLKQKILDAIWSQEKKIQVPVITIKPEVTSEALMKMNIKVEMASFSTKFDKTQVGRSTNIKLAAKKLDGYIIPPGEVFSFNDAVGERSSKEGYKEAPIFFNNEVISGIGGGVCQLSSTLYNLALITDLEIVERSNHSLPVNYVPLGRDATVNYGLIDLKFKNNTGGYLLLHAEVKEDTLTVKFYGSKKNDKKIKIVTEVVKKIPPPVTVKEDYSLEKGKIEIQEGRPGYQVKVWKIVSHNGTQEKKLLSIDTYNPTATIMFVGKKEPPAKTDPTKSKESAKTPADNHPPSEQPETVNQ